MSAYTEANPYIAHATIQHNEAAVVAAFQDAFPAGREGLSPVAAAGIYGAGGPAGPYTELPWLFADYLPSGIDVNVASGTFTDVVGDTVHYVWVIYMVFAGEGAIPGAETIRQRRWVEGWEIPAYDEGSGGTFVYNVSRDASRTPEGLGLAVRNRNQQYSRLLTTYLGSNPRGSWERIYLRLRTPPNSTVLFWRVFNSAGASVGGAAFYITNDGTVAVFNINSGGTHTLLGTTALVLNEWVRLDLVFQMNSGGNDAFFRLHRNGTLVFNVAVASGSGGLGQAGFHSSTSLGNATSLDGLELDVDDWINAEPPVLFNGLDWLTGSHVVLVRPDAFDGSHSGSWTGDFRTLLNNPPVEATSFLDSTTSGARMAVTTDLALLADRGWLQHGIPAFNVSIASSNAGGTDGTLGYSIGGAADVLETIDETTLLIHHAMMYRPSGLTEPLPDLAPLVLIHEKSADANDNPVYMLMAEAECLGAFGDGDYPDDIEGLPDVGVHNAPYVSPIGQFGAIDAPPFGLVGVMSGTYVGDGLGHDVDLDAPPHWIYIRPLTGNLGGVQWWSSMVGPHRTWSVFDLQPHLMPQVYIDAAGAVKMRIAGDDSQNNEAGITYQWVAFSDPAMRYLYCGAFLRNSALTAAVNPLTKTDFYAEGAFLIRESPGTVGILSAGYYKGHGNLNNTVSPVNAAQISNALTFGLGNLLSQQTPFHTQDQGVPFCLWRTNDSGGPPCSTCPQCDETNTGRPVAITSYTGNGGGARTITLELSNRFPLFAMVAPHNGSAYVRDPSHTGSDSNVWLGGTNSTTHITGGDVNQITVGTDLNQNGIIYEVFVLAGGTSGSGGWSTNGTHYPVPSGPPCGCTPWPCDDGGGGEEETGGACPENFSVNS